MDEVYDAGAWTALRDVLPALAHARRVADLVEDPRTVPYGCDRPSGVPASPEWYRPLPVGEPEPPPAAPDAGG